MGRNHLRVLSLLRSVEIAFVFDVETETATRLANAHSTTTDTDLDHLLPRADAVIVCTPTISHGDYLQRAADHVGYVFVEKPLAVGLEEARALSEFAMVRGIEVQVGFIERFNAAVQQLKAVLDESSQVISIDFLRTNKLSSRITDVDVITDLMVHDIDLALYLNGPVRDVSAHGVSRGRMVDFASALLTHTNGRFSRIQASRITEKKIRTIQATCADMYVDCELVRKELVINRQSEIQQETAGPYTISAIEQTIEVLPQEPLLSELQAFVALCQGEKPDIPTATDGLRAAEVCDRIQKAIES